MEDWYIAHRSAPRHHIAEQKQCSACGSVAYDSDRYCARCGNALFLICPSCRATVEHPVAFYCTQCGDLLGSGSSNGASASSSNVPAQSVVAGITEEHP